MKKFLLQAATLAFACFNTTQIFGATEGENSTLTDIALEVKDAAPSRTLTISKCVLDFSTPNKIAASSGKIAVYLLGEKANNTLDLTDIAYLTFEGIAAGARSNPDKFGKLAPYFSNPEAVYTNFMQIAGSIEVAQHELTILGDLTTCTTFVQGTIAKDLPALLTKLNVSPEDQADVALLATVFTPMFSQLLNKAYTRAMAAAGSATTAADKITEEVTTGQCGCFPWTGTPKKKTEK